MEVSANLELKVKIAHMYYMQGMTQQMIATAVGVSRPKVSRLLEEAKKEGIVTISIADTSIHKYSFEEKLLKKYSLKHALVVATHEDKEQTFKDLGTVCNVLLKQIVRGSVRIGISAGMTIYKISDKLTPFPDCKIDLYQLCGDASHQAENCPSFLTISLARQLDATPHAIHVPLLVNSKVLRDLLLEEPINRNHFKSLESLDLVLVGLGRIDSLLPTTSDTWYNFSSDKEQIMKKHCVGDLCGNFIDEHGNLCETDIYNRTIAIPLRFFHNIPDTIAVAIGKEKRDIARAALAGKYINSLIIDESLALALLEE